MRSCIRRLFSYSVLALIAAVLLLQFSGAAYAGSLKTGQYTFFGETVGVDPHLKVAPKVDSGPIRDLDGEIFSIAADGVDTAIMRDIGQLVTRQGRVDSE